MVEKVCFDILEHLTNNDFFGGKKKKKSIISCKLLKDTFSEEVTLTKLFLSPSEMESTL